MMLIHESHVFELRSEMKFEVCEPCNRFLTLLKPKRRKPDRDSNHDFYDAGVVLHHLSYQANWELVVMWVCYKPVNDGYRGI